jgi:hypothetical protein
MQPQKQTIAEKELDVFRKRTRIDADFCLCLYENTGAHPYSDGLVRLAREGMERKFKAETRLQVNRTTFALLTQKIHYTCNGLIVTEYVNTELAEEMRNQVIPFIDAAGDAFVNATPLVQMTYVMSIPRRLHLAMVPLHPKSTSSG